MKCAILFLMLCVLSSGGCSSSSESQAPAKTEESKTGKGAVETVVAGLTGQTAVHMGKEARSKILAIASNEQSSLEEAMR